MKKNEEKKPKESNLKEKLKKSKNLTGKQKKAKKQISEINHIHLHLQIPAGTVLSNSQVV